MSDLFKRNEFNLIGKDCVLKALSFLPAADQGKFSAIEKNTYDMGLVTTWLNNIVRGYQNKAQEMLQAHPGLLMQRGTVTDYSGRTFENITAVEHVAWALDHQMLWMIIDQITAVKDITERSELITKLFKQFNEVPERFSLKSLEDAYKKYLAEYTLACTSNDWTACETAWLEIGVEQSKLPANYAQYYCDPNLSFDPCPNASQLDSRTAAQRSERLDVDDDSTGRAGAQHWYAGLGINFTIVREWVGTERYLWAVRRRRAGAAGRPVLDLAAIEALGKVRIKEVGFIMTQLKQLLDSMAEQVAQRQRPPAL